MRKGGSGRGVELQSVCSTLTPTVQLYNCKEHVRIEEEAVPKIEFPKSMAASCFFWRKKEKKIEDSSWKEDRKPNAGLAAFLIGLS